MAKASPVKWTREHFLIALNLYCKLPFGQFHDTNPLIIQVAKKMGRSPGSLEMQLNNFASVDPVQQARGVKGLPGIAKHAAAMWTEYFSNLPVLGPQSEQLLHDIFTSDDDKEVSVLAGDKAEFELSKAPEGPTEITVTRKARRGQHFFRETILNAYGLRCCISGINVPRLLIASHIKPWGNFVATRLDPRNGLCLSSLHDAAFNWGLITLDEKFKVRVSKRLKDCYGENSVKVNFAPFEREAIRMPSKVCEPSQEYLDHHRKIIFQN